MRMILICLCAGAGLVAGCGDGGGERPRVIATTAIAADIVRHVAGPDSEVGELLGSSASPHGYSASAKDRARLEEADLVVAWGAGLEEGLPLDELDPPPHEMASGVEDPHVWMDPTQVADALPELAEALAAADPEHAERYRRRAETYAALLHALDRRLERILAAVPPENRKLVTSHDSLGHFARRYEFEFVGAPFGRSPDAEPSAEAVARLIDDVRRQRVRAVFAEDTDDPRLMRQIAREAGVEVVDDLLVEGFGEGVDSYEEVLVHDARRIADALAG